MAGSSHILNDVTAGAKAEDTLLDGKAVIPTFDNPQVAYKCKSTKELLRAYLVFRLCSIPFLVNNQYTVSR